MDQRIPKILACPLCKGRLHYNKETQELICHLDQLAYPICNMVPTMLAEQARHLKKESDIHSSKLSRNRIVESKCITTNTTI